MKNEKKSVREKMSAWIRFALRDIESMCKEHDDCETCPAAINMQNCKSTYIADYLIAHNVTIQKWISVKDGLPKEECRCLVIDAMGNIEMSVYDGEGAFRLDHQGALQHPSYWMSLPEMPR